MALSDLLCASAPQDNTCQLIRETLTHMLAHMHMSKTKLLQYANAQTSTRADEFAITTADPVLHAPRQHLAELVH